MSEAALVRAEELLAAPILCEAPRPHLARLLFQAERRTFSAGESIYRIRDAAEHVFLIERGEVDVEHDAGSATVRTEGYIGVESVLGAKYYTDHATARTALEVVVIPRSQLRELMEEFPRIERQFFDAYALVKGQSEEFTQTITGFISPGDGLPSEKIPKRELIGWVLAIALPCLAFALRDALTGPTATLGESELALRMLLMGSEDGLNVSQLYFATIILTAVTMWIFNLVPDFVPPLFSVVMIVLFDVATPAVALSGFTSQSFFLCLSVFGIGVLMATSGLSYRISLWLLRVSPQGLAGHSASLFTSGMLLTPIIPAPIARMTILSPFVIELIQANPVKAKSAIANRLIVSTLGGVALLIPLFLTASAPNLTVYGLFDGQTQFAFRWLQWFLAASLFGLIVLAAFFVLLALMFRPERSYSMPHALITEQLRVLGRLSHAERAAMLAVGVMAIGVITRSMHNVEIAWLALAILIGLLLLGDVGAEVVRRRIDWPTLIFIGAIIGWVPTMRSIGLDAEIAAGLGWLGAMMSTNLELFVLGLIGCILIVRLAIPTTATVVLLATALFPVASANGVSQWFIGFVLLALADTFIFPYQSSYYVKLRSDLAAQGLDHVLDARRIMVFNLMMIAVRIGAIYASMPFWRWLDILVES